MQNPESAMFPATDDAAIADLRARFKAADDEVYRVLQADDFAMIGGNYDAALRAREACRHALADAVARVSA